MQAFYNNVTKAMKSIIDATAGGTLMNKTEEEEYNLIQKMALNNYQWSNKSSPSKKVRDKFDVDTLTLCPGKMDAMTQILNHLNVNVVNACAPPLLVIIMDLLTIKL